MEKAGFTREQAEASVKLLIDVMDQNFATKADLKELELSTKADFKQLELSMRGELRELEFKLTTRLGSIHHASRFDDDDFDRHRGRHH